MGGKSEADIVFEILSVLPYGCRLSHDEGGWWITDVRNSKVWLGNSPLSVLESFEAKE